MARSMTGFGRGEYSDSERRVTAEIKSVNHRYSEIAVRMPRKYTFAEEAVKAVVKKAVPRGKVEVGISVESAGRTDTAVKLDASLARQYYDALTALGAEFPDVDARIDLRMLVSMPEVITGGAAELDEEALTAALCAAARQAADNISQMRETEGAKLAEDILYRGGLIEKTVEEIEQYAPSVQQQYFEKMKARIAELTEGQVQIPEDRIVLEAAVFADKANITEEIIRLKSHVSQLRVILAQTDEPVGKKLDFLVQEMNREANTIGSKANDINITNNVLVLKAEIEKIREQVQNIE